MLQNYKVAAVKWGVPSTQLDPRLINTCSYDSILFVLYFLHKNNILEKGIPGINHPESKARQIFELLDDDKGDDARRLLIFETLKDNKETNKVAQLFQPDNRYVDVFGGVSDSLPVLLFGAFLQIRHRKACSLGCQKMTEWSIQKQYVHTINTHDFPESLEDYLEKAFNCHEMKDDEGQCTMSALPIDLTEDIPNDAEGDEEKNEFLESLKRSQGYCMGKPLLDRQLLSVPSLVALKHVMQIRERKYRVNRKPIKYTDLPEIMWVANLQFQLRGVVLGDNSHFISLVLINDNWLWYDGLGTKLQVFGRYDSGGQSDVYSCSLMFYEVTPMDKEAE